MNQPNRPQPFGFKHDANQLAIPAYRYLAFLTTERRYLLDELFPDNPYWFAPIDNEVFRVVSREPPTARAEAVLATVGITSRGPHGWLKYIGHPTLQKFLTQGPDR